MARAWFLRVLLNSSSFSAILRSISCLTWPSSSWALSTLFSSASRDPSASSRAPCSSSFSAAIAKLVQQILDLVRQVLVLTADDVQLLVGLVKSGLEAEPLVAVVASLGVRGVQLGHQVVSLRLPLADNLVEVLAALLGDAGSGVGPLVLHGQLLELGVHASSRLLSRSNLGVQSLDVLLGLGDLGGQLVLGSLKLVDAAKSLGLVLGLPQLDLRLGLAQGLENVVLLLRLLVDLHPQVLRLRAESLELGEQGSAVASLTVGELLGVLQLGSQGDLVLLQSSDGVLSLLNLARELVGLDNQALGHLAVLLHVGTLAHGLLESGPSLLEIPLHASLVLLGLGLVLVDAVDLVAKLSHGVVVLLAEGSQGAFVGNVGLIQVSLQLDQLGLTLLVQLNLGAGVGANLSEPGAQILEVPGQQGTVLLGLGAVVPLHGQLLVELVNAGLQLLHLLGVLGAEGLLVLNLGGNGGDLLVLALHGLTELRVDTLEVSNSLLGELEVSLNLPLLLFDVALGLLLALKSVLALVEGLLKLSLHLVQVVAPVLSGLDVLLSLLPTLSGGLLLLAELDDHVLLVGNLVPEGADLGVLGVLVLLALLDGRLEVLDLLSQPAGISSDLGASLLDLVDLVVLALNAGVGGVNLLLQVVLSSLQPVGLVDDLLHSGATGLQSKHQLVLLGGELAVDLNHSGALAHSLVDVGLGDGNLLLVLLLVLAELGQGKHQLVLLG